MANCNILWEVKRLDERINEWKVQLKKILKESRYEHTIGVADTCACLAMRYGASVESAYIAGLLHDNARNIEAMEQLHLCKENSIAISKAEQKTPYLLHAKLGAHYANVKFGIEDREILSAIQYHTTGKPAMTTLEQIVFTADFIEPNRKMIPNLPSIRQLAFQDLDRTVECILKSTIDYLSSKGLGDSMDEMTMLAYDYYTNHKGEML